MKSLIMKSVALSTDYFLRMAVCSFFFLFCANTAQAKGIPLFFNWGTEIYIVEELPDDCRIQTADHGIKHANLGVAYDEFALFGSAAVHIRECPFVSSKCPITAKKWPYSISV